MIKSSVRQSGPAWKVLLAFLSILLTIFIWTRGLQESFNRPSVSPKLSLHQNEVALLAEPSLSKDFKNIFIGNSPKETLSNLLKDIPVDQISDRERLVLAGLESGIDKRSKILEAPLLSDSSNLIKDILLTRDKDKKINFEELSKNELLKKDPLLYRLTCFSIYQNDSLCIDYNLSKSMAFRLITSQLIPILSALIGSYFLIRQCWIIIRNKSGKWPVMSYIPLSLLDMLLLVSGGFVVLGEVIFPTLIAPISIFLTKGFPSPISDSLRVFIGYASMTIAPLFILRTQLRQLNNIDCPPNGWLEWKIFPLRTSVLEAIKGWLMVVPIVLLTGWLMNVLVGDQGGSNPLLELVLQSRSPIALSLLIVTTVILAPLFEELIFRGVLLPVLYKHFGSVLGITLSALAFGLAHLSVGELAPLFVLGIGLALLRCSTGRLFPCVLMHSLWNGITFANLVLLGA